MSRFPLPRLPSWPYLAPRQELGEAAPAPYVMRCTWEHSQAIIKTLALHCTEHFLAIMRPATCVCSGHWWAGAPGLGTVSLAKYYLAFSWLGTFLTFNCFSAQVLNCLGTFFTGNWCSWYPATPLNFLSGEMASNKRKCALPPKNFFKWPSLYNFITSDNVLLLCWRLGRLH